MKKTITLICVLLFLVSVTACAASVGTSLPSISPTAQPTAEPTPTPVAPTPDPTPAPRVFLASEMIKNAEIWNGNRLLDDAFQFIVEYYDDRIISDGLGVNYNNFGGDFLHMLSSAGEWGYCITSLDGQVDGSGRFHDTQFDGVNAPKTRQEALDKILDYLNRTYLSNVGDEKRITSMNGHYPWHHYAGMAGFNNIGTEIGEGMSSYQLRIAMNRGAAKQYGATWFVDFSQWYGGYILDYREGKTANASGSINGGHSLNLMERSLLLAFMGGADATIAEGGQYIAYDEEGNITPYGELCRKMNAFTTAYNDVGTAYTPYAFILDKYHGMDSGSPGKIFDNFMYTQQDKFTHEILNEYIWPSAIKDTTGKDEATVMTHTPFGDSFDFLLQDAPTELLQSYHALIFTGNIQLSERELNSYAEYVRNGGKLVLNTAYLDQFSSLGVEFPNLELQKFKSVQYGDGYFMIYGSGGRQDSFILDDGTVGIKSAGDWMLGGLRAILEELHSEYMPFTFSEDIGYCVSVKDGKLYLMLFNNDGVHKAVNEPTVTDENEKVKLTVTYTGEHQVRSCADVYNSTPLDMDEKSFTLELGAGGIAVVELNIGLE